MLTQTTALIVTVVLAVIAALIVLVSVVRGMKRSLLRGGMSILVAVVSLSISILLSQLVGKALVGVVLKLVDPGTVEMVLGALPSAPEAAEALIKMLIAPLVIVPIFLVLYLVVGGIVGSIVRRLEEGRSPLARKNMALGALIGTVCGVLLVVVVMAPLAGYTAIADKALDTGVLEMTEEPMLSVQEQEVVRDILNTPVLSITRKLGGQAIFDGLTSAKVAGEKVTLSHEIGAICQLAKSGMPLTEKPVDQYGEAEFAIIQEQLPLVFENSSLLRVLGAEALSGMSRAWMKGETFLGMERPNFDNAMISVVVDSALGLFRDTTKDTLVNDIRGLTPLISIAATATQLGEGANLTDLMDALAEHADSPEIKYLLLNAGVGILAQELGLYNNKDEIYDEYVEALAVLSVCELTEEELCEEIKNLNADYAISMTEEECASLAASLINNPCLSILDGEEPTLLYPATGYPTFAPAAATDSPVFTLLNQANDFSAWLTELFEEVPEAEKEALSWLASEKKEIPTQLVTGEDLAALTTKEMAAGIGKEQMTALLTAATQIMSGTESGEDMTLEDTLEAVGTALGSMTSSESGKALVTGLVTGVLQSDKAKDALGITSAQATTIANSIKDNGVENLGQTVKDVNQLMNVVTHLKDGNVSSGEQLSPDDFRTLLMTMNDSSASLLRSLCTADMLKKTGLPAESAAGVSHLINDLLAELVEARKTWSEDAYQKEADALYRILLLATGAKNSSGSTFEDRIGMSASQLIEVIQASELLTTVLPDSIDALYKDNPDALGLSKKLDEQDRAHLLEMIAEYKKTADEGGDALLDALARMLG